MDKHQVNILYTAPTAIRALMAEGDKAIEGTDRSSLRILGSVGEPIDPEAWEWYWKKIGNEKCPVVDTWWRPNRRIHDHPAAGRHRTESRFCNPSILWRTACDCR
ncbi:AMP-binding protein [Shigella flexneri]